LIAKKNIDLNGQNVMTDSFDSSNPLKSTGGQYDPAKYRGDKGDVATDLAIIDSLNAGNADIYGHAHTGPGSPTTAVEIGSNGYIGSHADQATIVYGIDPGWWLSDANFTFPVTTYPNTTGYLTPTGGVVTTSSLQVNTYSSNSVALPNPIPAALITNTTQMKNMTLYPSAGTYVPPVTTNYFGSSSVISSYTYNSISSYSWSASITTTNYSTNSYNHILWGNNTGTNYYVASDLGGQTLVLGPNVVLALPNGLNMSSSDGLTLSRGDNIVGATFAPAAIIIYSGGTSCALGGIANQTGYAADFLLFCAPTVTSFALNGNGGFIGVLVAPTVDISLNGSGDPTHPTDFSGCLMANSLTLNGHFNFHYDEALLSNATFGRFLITAWNEIK
jgi:hypothetical protein